MAITRGGKAKQKLARLGYSYDGYYEDYTKKSQTEEDQLEEDTRDRIRSASHELGEKAAAALVLDAFGIRKRYRKRAVKEGYSAETLFLRDLRETLDLNAKMDAAVRIDELREASADKL